MRALSVSRFEGFDALTLSELPDPEPAAGESLVQVRAVALSRSDLASLIDRTTERSEPLIPGLSVAGTVVRDRRFPAGTPVLIDPYLRCGACSTCRVGSGCSSPSVLGRQRPGGIAELVTTTSRSLVPIPRTLSFVEGSAIAASGSIASKVLLDDAGVASGERILLTGSTGALGLAVLQLGRALHCHVSAMVTRPDRVGLALESGAHHAIAIDLAGRSATTEDLGGAVDVIVHLATDAGWITDLVPALRSGGRVVLRRVQHGEMLKVDVGQLVRQGHRLIGSTGSSSGGLAAMVAALAGSPVRPSISEVLPWEEYRQGLKLLAGRTNRGAVVLTMS